MQILFIQAGGTIDKDYPRLERGYAFEITDPAVLRVIENANPAFGYIIMPLLQKDSIEMTDEDRETIRNACESAAYRHIIVTHGTDTMIETAQRLSGIKGKVIILTGAMRPERFSNSDAAFNIGVAIGALQCLPPGVYIAMHGGVYLWDKVTRNGQGQFVEKGTGL
jgi:L-asparaginase